MCGLDLSDLDWGPVTSCCEHGNESLGCIKAGNFLTVLVTVKFPMKDSAPWSYLIYIYIYIHIPNIGATLISCCQEHESLVISPSV